MHLCLTVECIAYGLHLSFFLIRSPPPPPYVRSLTSLSPLDIQVVELDAGHLVHETDPGQLLDLLEKHGICV